LFTTNIAHAYSLHPPISAEAKLGGGGDFFWFSRITLWRKGDRQTDGETNGSSIFLQHPVSQPPLQSEGRFVVNKKYCCHENYVDGVTITSVKGVFAFLQQRKIWKLKKKIVMKTICVWCLNFSKVTFIYCWIIKSSSEQENTSSLFLQHSILQPPPLVRWSLNKTDIFTVMKITLMVSR